MVDNSLINAGYLYISWHLGPNMNFPWHKKIFPQKNHRLDGDFLVGGFSPTPFEKYATVQMAQNLPQFSGWKMVKKKHSLSCHHRLVGFGRLDSTPLWVHMLHHLWSIRPKPWLLYHHPPTCRTVLETRTCFFWLENRDFRGVHKPINWIKLIDLD